MLNLGEGEVGDYEQFPLTPVKICFVGDNDPFWDKVAAATVDFLSPLTS